MTATAPPVAQRLSANARAAAAVLRCASDVSLVVGPDRRIREIRVTPELAGVVLAARGAAAIDIVHPQDRDAFAAALGVAASGGIPDTVEVRHLGRASDLVLRYAALPADDSGDVLLIGRLLQGNDALSLRVSETRLAVDRDALSRRATEVRYQVLFEGAAEAILVVTPASGIVDDANPRALSLLGLPAIDVVGQPLARLLPESDRDRVAKLVAALGEGGEVAALKLTLAHSGRRVSLHGRAFRAFDRTQLMLQLDDVCETDGLAPAEALVAGLLRDAGQAVALTDAGGRILWASDGFPRPATVSAGSLVGRTIPEVLEGAGTVLRSVLNAAREHGRISCPGIQLSADAGHVRGDLTVISLAGHAPAGFGIFFREETDSVSEASSRQAVEADEIGAILGQAPLKDLVRDAADMIERSCIEAALRLTAGNKAAAAEVLGLSRQSLYLKLHRFALL